MNFKFRLEYITSLSSLAYCVKTKLYTSSKNLRSEMRTVLFMKNHKLSINQDK